MQDTVWWGQWLLGTTWLLFILGIGGVCGMWEWSLQPIRIEKTETVHENVEKTDGQIIKGDETLAMRGYYSTLTVLTGGVVAWIWVTINWVGMKYFRHN